MSAPLSTPLPSPKAPPSCPRRHLSWLTLCLAGLPSVAQSQMAPPPPGPLDPARTAHLRAAPPSHLTEQFIWTAGDAAAQDPALQASVRAQDAKIAPHFFRAHFHLATVPPSATLYLAGPRSATVFLNGRPVLHATDDGTRPKNLSVLTADVSHTLHPGDNVLAIEEVRGHSSLHTGASPTINQVTYGEVLVAKIAPRPLIGDAPPLVISDTHWRSTLTPASGWQDAAFDDSSWPLVESLGVIGSKRDFLQWNADAGLYAWPGYTGISASLRVFTLPAVAIEHIAAPASFRNTASLLTRIHKASIFTATPSPSEPASVTLDFGREVSGRIHLVSASDRPAEVLASYGESPEEADRDQGYLGTRLITVPPHAAAFGPKSAFRYVKLTFPAAHEPSRWSAIDVQAITYPVTYLGSFESSDPELNRIWETGAYTAHLCMQDDLWDAPKRDRGRWMPAISMSTGRVISTTFGDTRRAHGAARIAEIIAPAEPVARDINGIPGYTALWITSLGRASTRHSGDLAFLRSSGA